MKLLILTSSTGGGHNMRANAFKEWAGKREDVEVRIHQTLETAHALYRFGVWTYNAIQRYAPWMHHVYFNYLEEAAMTVNPDGLLGREHFEQLIEEYRPDVVISTHAHLNHGYFALVRRVLGREKVKCITYCGELFGGYGFCRYWVNPAADLFIGAVRETCGAASYLGMVSSRIWNGGFMLRPSFYEPSEGGGKALPYAEPGCFKLVLGTGSNAANNHVALLDSLEKARLRVAVYALCGRSREAYDEVSHWGRQAVYVRVRALSHVSDMKAVLDGADAIVARPGTGTTSEAILANCPLIFNGIGGIMPQEWITMKYARSHMFGRCILSADQLPAKVSELMTGNALKLEREKMTKCVPKGSPSAVIDRVLNL